MFKPFTTWGASSRSSITLRTSGALFVSKNILNKLLPNPQAVILYFDEHYARIGIQFIEKFRDEIEGCRKISKEKSGISFNVLPLLKHYGIENVKKRKQFRVKLEADLLVIDLDHLKREQA